MPLCPGGYQSCTAHALNSSPPIPVQSRCSFVVLFVCHGLLSLSSSIASAFLFLHPPRPPPCPLSFFSRSHTHSLLFPLPPFAFPAPFRHSLPPSPFSLSLLMPGEAVCSRECYRSDALMSGKDSYCRTLISPFACDWVVHFVVSCLPLCLHLVP